MKTWFRRELLWRHGRVMAAVTLARDDQRYTILVTPGRPEELQCLQETLWGWETNPRLTFDCVMNAQLKVAVFDYLKKLSRRVS